ncbi:MAG: hypothetical protein HUU47_08780 [Bacteroidetes bacterium]|nr:hypothetical protein [Bacteroidota bacterium]
MTTETNNPKWLEAMKIDEITKWYENNRKNANIGMIALIAIIAGVFYYFKYYKPQIENEAAAQLFMAERYFEKDSMDKVLKGDGKYSSAPDIADEYGNTKAGNLAKYYAGRAYMSKGDFKKALEYIEDASFNDEIMSSMIIGLQADCYSELGDLAKAADTYMKAAQKRENLYTSPMFLMKAGIHYEEVKKWEEAVKAYTMIKDKYKESRQAQLSMKYIARAMAHLGKTPE